MASRRACILYLDFDGVLHHYDVYLDPKNRPILRGMGALFEYADRLERALDQHPNVRIVLSTSWVRVKGFDRSCRRLPVALRERVIAATWHSSFAKDQVLSTWWTSVASRYEQIALDVARRKPADWLALDDDEAGWPELERRHLIKCDPLFGLSEPATRLFLEQTLHRWK